MPLFRTSLYAKDMMVQTSSSASWLEIGRAGSNSGGVRGRASFPTTHSEPISKSPSIPILLHFTSINHKPFILLGVAKKILYPRPGRLKLPFLERNRAVPVPVSLSSALPRPVSQAHESDAKNLLVNRLSGKGFKLAQLAECIL